MITANLDGVQQRASRDMPRRSEGANWTCVECMEPVDAKPGRQVKPHFAHKPGSSCKAFEGETDWHIDNKHRLVDELQSAGYNAVAEYKIQNRRADVALPEKKIAFELQRSSIGYHEIQARCEDYRRMGWRSHWIFELGKANTPVEVYPRTYERPPTFTYKVRNLPMVQFFRERQYRYARPWYLATHGTRLALADPQFLDRGSRYVCMHPVNWYRIVKEESYDLVFPPTDTAMPNHDLQYPSWSFSDEMKKIRREAWKYMAETHPIRGDVL